MVTVLSYLTSEQYIILPHNLIKDDNPILKATIFVLILFFIWRLLHVYLYELNKVAQVSILSKLLFLFFSVL